MISSELVKQYLDALEEEHYFGEVVLELKNGKVMDCDVKQKIKALDIRNKICNNQRK